MLSVRDRRHNKHCDVYVVNKTFRANHHHWTIDTDLTKERNLRRFYALWLDSEKVVGIKPPSTLTRQPHIREGGPLAYITFECIDL